ncbi:MAG: hypothetical protein NTV54_04045, partial [Ignavibacteriales bacterium]|nr:hypothetical protein [Ignavibacteriales bacterium]
MKNMIRFAAFVSMLAMLSTTVQAQVALPFYDGFNYPVGQNLGAQPSWATLNTGDSLTIAAGNLSYPGFAASTGNKIAFDGAGTDAAKRFDTVYTGTVYFSFLVKVANLGSLAAAGGYFVGFYQSSASVTTGAPVYVRPDGAGIDFG